jgi:Leucine-rich repeat (LRR) protein
MYISVFSQTVEIPDKNFEKALIDLQIDSDGIVNGLILKSDVQLVTSLDVSNKKIKDLTGIEAFTSLIYFDCRDNKLSNLDVSQNIGLITLSTNVNHLIANRNSMNLLNWFDE